MAYALNQYAGYKNVSPLRRSCKTGWEVLMKKILIILAIILIAVLGYGVYFIDTAMPIGNGYAAKYICSQVFIDGRDPAYVFEKEVKPTNPLFSLTSPSVDFKNRTVTSKAYGFRNPLTAVYRDQFGCTLAIDATREELYAQTRGALPPKKPDMASLWPKGEKLDLDAVPANVDKKKLAAVIEDAFREPGPKTMRNTQGVVIVYNGRIIAERYAKGFTPATSILGWSMTKGVTNALIGILARQKKIDIYRPAPVAAWKSPGDPRGAITTDMLLRMSSGLDFVEEYGPHKDVTDMLYGAKSMADFASAKPMASKPDGRWYYSSGDANIVARIVRDLTGGTLASVYNFARRNLFDKLNMCSAIIEPDASGSIVGSSYMFATPRDWARMGLLFLNDGVWNGERILPEGWVKYTTTPTPLAPKGEYGAHFWLNHGAKGDPKKRDYPSLPTELFGMDGFNDQYVFIIPSRKLVVVRMGVTHDDSWKMEDFTRRVLECVGK